MFPTDLIENESHTEITIKNLDQINSFCSLPGFENFKNNILNLIHINIRSLRANFNEFKSLLFCYIKNVQIIILSEIWVSEHEVNLYSIDGYNMFNCCRNFNRSGGVIVYVRENFDFETKLQWNMLSAEGIILFSEKFNLCLIALYRSHSYKIDFFNQELSNLLSNIKFKDCVLIGDMNINILDNSNLSNEYLNILSENGFLSMLNLPTRVTNLSETCIDHIFAKNSLKRQIGTARVIYELTDHYPILCNITVPKSNNLPDLIKQTNFKIDYKLLEQQIDKFELQNAVQDVNVFYNEIQTKLQSAINNSYVIKQNHRKGKNDWINDNILKLINDKQKFYKKTKKYPYNVNLRMKYKNIIAELKQKIKIAKETMYKVNFLNCQNDERKKWDFVNNIVGRNKNRKFPIIKVTDRTVNDFNDFFVNCAVSNNSTSSIRSNVIANVESTSFFLYDVTEQEVGLVVNALNDRKSVGFDKISAVTLKLFFKYRPEIFVNLINMSFDHGVFPDNLKLAVVSPIYKAGDKNHLGNYRPISVLPFFSKVIETTMKNRLYQFLTKKNFFSENQFGFIKGKGTEDALLRFTTTIYKSLNDNFKTLAIFIDISKAFDSVNHDILLRKLYLAGVRGNQHDWFKSYLNERKQFVKLNNIESNRLIIKKGVPQGSILGPLLFIFFINNLCNLKLFGRIITYADDTVLIYSAKTY